MKLLLKRHGAFLYPVGETDRVAMDKIRGVVECTIKNGRSLLFHRKLFALIKLGFDNQEHYDEFEAYRFVLLLKTGNYTTIQTDKEMPVYMPISLSFDKLNQEQVEQVYRSVLDYLMATLKTDEQTIINELINFM